MEGIITALKSIQEKGSFCGKREAPTDSLQLEVKQFGPLKFPVNSKSAKALIKIAKPAKFGWRDQTLLDKTVRDAWEISKSNININNTLWNKKLKSILKLLGNDLGLPDGTELKASLHNLLIYEPGQFFNYHQDSEKLDGMVATLIVVLPSEHKGGTLTVENQGSKKQFQSSRFSLDKLTFIAFYADCHHAINAVTEGYRLALTYNLTVDKPIKKTKATGEKPIYGSVIESLRTYFADRTTPNKFIYLLDHDYTQKGLSWNHLKNGDNLRAEALIAAADVLDLEIYLALADVQETWACESNYDFSWGQCSYSEDEDDDEDDDDIELTEFIDGSTVLRHWRNREDKVLAYKECNISDDCIFWTKASDEFKPFQSEHEGYMGNYGDTMEHWYHRAAIVLWRKKDHYPVLFNMDSASVVTELLKLTKKKTNESHVRAIIDSLLPQWTQHIQRNNKESVTIEDTFKLALYVKHADIAEAVMDSFEISALIPERVELFLSLEDVYGIAWCLRVLEKWTKPKEVWKSVVKCENLSTIIKKISRSKSDQKKLMDWLLIYQLKAIKEQHMYYKKNGHRLNLIKGTTQRMKEVDDFISACIIVNNFSIYGDLLNHVLDNSDLYPALNLIKTVFYLRKTLKNDELSFWGYETLVDCVFKTLTNEKNEGLRKAGDWSIKKIVPCECGDCDVLRKFLQSKTSKTVKWALAEKRRAHIHNTINDMGVPVTHETERIGTPYKLVLIKTDELHIESKKRFKKVEQALLELAELITLKALTK